jgi:hypothetical protein
VLDGTVQNGWQAQIERYGTAIIKLLNEIADIYLDEIDWHIVGREEDVLDWFEPTKAYRWHLLVDAGNKSYLSFDVEILAENNTLGFRARYEAMPERVPITQNVEDDMEKLRAIAFKAFAEGRAGKIRVERQGLLSHTYKVTTQTAQGELELSIAVPY